MSVNGSWFYLLSHRFVGRDFCCVSCSKSVPSPFCMCDCWALLHLVHLSQFCTGPCSLCSMFSGTDLALSLVASSDWKSFHSAVSEWTGSLNKSQNYFTDSQWKGSGWLAGSVVCSPHDLICRVGYRFSCQFKGTCGISMETEGGNGSRQECENHCAELGIMWKKHGLSKSICNVHNWIAVTQQKVSTVLCTNS